MGNPKPIYRFSHHDFSDITVLLVNWQENITQQYYLMFGRKPHLPIGILFGTNTADLKGNTSTKYVENL